MTEATAWVRSFTGECRRRLVEESLPRLRTCLSELGEDEIWARPNEASNSMGNLVLHLRGNVGQYVVSGLGGAPDGRDRAAEFSERGPLPKARLLSGLERTLAEAARVIEGLDEARLLARYRIQGYDLDGIGVLVHVVEHFSYHTGQVAYFTKARKGIDLGFYRGVDLARKNRT
jgi:uncharacterized damage-inducible protein DinB